MYYSQSGEDQYLNEHIFKNKKNGVYIELGALDGVTYSNTKFFEDSLDWTGILIEPHPIIYNRLQENRPNNILSNDLVSCNEEPLEFMYFIHRYAPCSGVKNTLSQHHMDVYYNNEHNPSPQGKIILKPKTLTEIIKSTNITHIDFLSLDVEGHEYEVLTSWDFSIPIDIILIETLGYDLAKDQLCRDFLTKNNYQFVSICGCNEIYSHPNYNRDNISKTSL
jgi:FkbM family methyltransferase